MMAAHKKHSFRISREIYALSYRSCSCFGNELNPETNLAALSLNIANNTPTITNPGTNMIHIQNPQLHKSIAKPLFYKGALNIFALSINTIL